MTPTTQSISPCPSSTSHPLVRPVPQACGPQVMAYALLGIDLDRCCHTQQGIGHALQAGEQATGSFM
jgi:hypothetical protein